MNAVALNSRERVAKAWAVLHGVPDPEVPALSLCDLGLVRELSLADDGALDLVLTPTYSGCPATEQIERDAVAALTAAGFGPVRLHLRRAPAWSSDWISAEGREKLRAYGIAPPGPVDVQAGVPVRLLRRPPPPACPRCASLRTERLSAFGSTACKSLHRCCDCSEPFEHFKAI